MRTFKTRRFARFARCEDISDEALREAIQRAKRGLIDADLGGGLIKLRFARAGAGKSGGYRMIVAFRSADRAVFLDGFAKSELNNISRDELVELRVIAQNWLRANAETLRDAVKSGVILEMRYDDQDESIE
jgi:hypothetical protein